MWQKLWHNRSWAAVVAGVSLVCAFAPIDLFPLVFVCPPLLNMITLREPSFKAGFRFGFLCSLMVMLGSFYWVVYTIHVFGYLPWSVSTLLFIGFCGFGALNFPLFMGIASALHRRFALKSQSARLVGLWFAVGLPALFTVLEFLVPKLFPWSIGHFFYRVPGLTQIVELTGCTYLSFITYSLGSVIGLHYLSRTDGYPFWKPAWAIPGTLWALDLLFSTVRLVGPPPPTKPFTVGMIQANIGSLEKVAARQGIYSKVKYVIDRYTQLSQASLTATPRPDLLIWPETAVPFQMESTGPFANEIRNSVKRWNVPLITGAYAQSPFHANFDYNAAFLLDPLPNGEIRTEMYPKNILLAFGEYMPFGERFPILYEKFPQVSNFERGKRQNPFTLKDGTKLGISICYEAIVPEFFRKVAAERAQLFVNITNDSWFGPTSEPSQHGALSVFRAIEYRVPLIRVTNTGISFAVDAYGRMSRRTGIYEEEALNVQLKVPLTPPETFYLNYGEWFIILLLVPLFALILVLLRKGQHVSLPV